MNSWHLVVLGAAVVGLASGQGSLEWAVAAEPRFGWGDAMFAFIAGTIGMALVVGFQLVQKNEQYGTRAFRFMAPIAIFIAASGVGALAVAIHSGKHGPAAWLFLACGAGALLGLWASLRMLGAMSASQRFDSRFRSFLRICVALVLGYLASSFAASVVLAVLLYNTPGAALGAYLVIIFPAFPLFLFGNAKADTWWWFPAWVIAFVVFSLVIWLWLKARARRPKLPNRPLAPVR